MISIPDFMNDPNKLTLTLKYIVSPRSTTTHTCVLDQNNHVTSQFSFKTGTGLLENCEVEVEIHL